jgi:hypothetical protein
MLTTVCLVTSILGDGTYMAQKQTALLKGATAQHMKVLTGELNQLDNAIATFDYAGGVIQCEALLKKYSVPLTS